MATYLVTSEARTGAGTLGDALFNARINLGADVIEFAPDVHRITVGQSGYGKITEDLTINGDRDGDGTPDVTISGDPAARFIGSPVIEVDSAARLDLNGLAFEYFRIYGTREISLIDNDGELNISHSSFSNIAISEISAGGTRGVVMNSGQFTVTDTIVGSNTATAFLSAQTPFSAITASMSITDVIYTGGTGDLYRNYGSTDFHADWSFQPAGPIADPAARDYGVVIGTSMADVLSDNSGFATVNGLDGNDRLFAAVADGGAGNDYIEADEGYGDIGNDTIEAAVAHGGANNDLIRADVAYGDAGNDDIIANEAHGGDGADTLEGDDADNVLYGDADEDTLIASLGTDDIYGGGGTDLLDFSGSTVSVAVRLSSGGSFDGGEVVLHGDIEYVRGSTLDDRLIGSVGTNKLFGDDGDDRLSGKDGNDYLDGEAGADVAAGGLGRDIYYVDDVNDRVVELDREGFDIVLSRASSFKMHGFAEELRLLGNAAIDGSGNGVNNLISGNGAANVLNGRAGTDSVTGNGGEDTFQFDTRLSASNVDQIVDFKVADDTIELSQAIFSALGVGALSAGEFHNGAAAHDASDRIVYDGATGKLLYDPDGAGGRAATQFATLSKGLAIDELDFVVA